MSHRYTLPTLPRSRSTPKPSYYTSPIKSPIKSPKPSAWALSPGRIPRHETQVRVKEKHNNGVIGFLKRMNNKKSKELLEREETMHMLRVFSCKLLQWRFVNARSERATKRLRSTTERKIFFAWLRISELQSIVAAKMIMIQRLNHNIKLARIINPQMYYFNHHRELVATRHQDAVTELSRTFESIQLRLPLTDGARANLVLLDDHISLSMEIMLEIEAAIHEFYYAVEEVAKALKELSKIVVQEIEKLEELRRTISKIVASELHEVSLRANVIQATKKEL